MRVFILALVLVLFGCLQFTKNPDVKIENLNDSQGKYSKLICYEFNSQKINGNDIKRSDNRFDLALETRYFEYQKLIRTILREKAFLEQCVDGKSVSQKILISFDWNINPDCTRKNESGDFNGCQIWNFMSGLTLGIIPFWGSTTSEIEFKIVDPDFKNYKYSSRVYTIISIFLLPVSWIHFIRSASEQSISQCVDLFLVESGLLNVAERQNLR
ncbi:hypothetical protein [Leptospira santarosai]|uniref:hypothetical protein n=1 Tax=Leptospira santarosai TaxID=28183 RepID=UPI0002BFA516|nr:hypothetical protein [Leptospira santarosai]EMP02511.1 putative lipoprotein [Leptospira santarosai str. HAI1380]MDI7230415.1 hypothetical protein [Leptospira santarosai]